MKTGLLLTLFAVFLTASSSQAGEYIYSKLQMKNYDEMQNAVNARVQMAKKLGGTNSDGARADLRDALQLILSRPDSDNMVSELIPSVRTPLRNLGSYEKTMNEIVDHAISNLNDKKQSAAIRATGLIILQNILSELKPDLRRNKKVRAMFEKIRDAKIKIPDAVKSELFMRSSMRAGLSPSEIASTILKDEK